VCGLWLLAPAESIVSAFLPAACCGPRLRRTAFGLFILFLWPSDINIGMNKFDTFYESMMNDAGVEDAEGAMEGKTMTVSLNNNELLKLEDKYKCNREVLNLALEYSLAQYKEHIDYNLHDEVQDAGMDVGKEAGVEDAESPMDAIANITGEINGNGRMAAEAISNIYSLVEDEGQEMLDKQAAEKLEDIKEFVSNLLRNLNNRLD